MSNYSELLKDPRWQKKRLEIMERDNWQCQCCYSQTSHLNVHHLWYKGKPWDVQDFALVTLCEDCHSKEANLVSRFPDVVKAFNQKGVLTSSIGKLLIVTMQYLDHAEQSRKIRPEVIQSSRGIRARIGELISLIEMELEKETRENG